MAQQNNSKWLNMKTRRSFSHQEPPTTLRTTNKSSNTRTFVVPSTILERQQFISELNTGEIKENSTVNDSGELISISEFSIAPRTNPSITAKPSGVGAALEEAGAKNKRSFSLNEPPLSSENAPSTETRNLNQYINETSPWRVLRNKLKLPEYRLKIDGRNALQRETFNSALHEVYSKQDQSQAPLVRLESTYRLGPNRRCDHHRAEELMKTILSGFVYNLETSNTMSSLSSIKSSVEHLTTLIKTRIKLILDPRYKIIVYAIIIEKQYQGVMLAAKCLWDVENDVCITVKENFKNYTIVVNLYAVYHE